MAGRGGGGCPRVGAAASGPVDAGGVKRLTFDAIGTDMTHKKNLPPVPAAEANRHIAELEHQMAQQAVAELWRIQGELSLAAFKGLTLANGGALIALFTFVGNSSAGFDPSRIDMAFFCFVAGLTLSLASTLCSTIAHKYLLASVAYYTWNMQAEMHGYERQHSDQENQRGTASKWWEAAALSSAAASLSAFATGAWYALHGVLY
jgi:hypothetical protein